MCWARLYPLTVTCWRYARDTYESIPICCSLERIVSCVCPSCCLWSIDGRRTWWFTGTLLWYTWDSLCRRRTMITRRKINGSSIMCATRNLEKSIKYQSSQIGIMVFNSYQTKVLRIRPIESEKEYRDLTLSTLYSDEVRTPLLPLFNRCGAESQLQRPTWWSCLAGSVRRMQIKGNAHQDRYPT